MKTIPKTFKLPENLHDKMAKTAKRRKKTFHKHAISTLKKAHKLK